jgi:hypothetical protein
LSFYILSSTGFQPVLLKSLLRVSEQQAEMTVQYMLSNPSPDQRIRRPESPRANIETAAAKRFDAGQNL